MVAIFHYVDEKAYFGIFIIKNHYFGLILSILSLALIFFIITNPIGNSPTIIAIIKDHTIKAQQRILLRESIFSFLIAVFFLFLGDRLEKNLCIHGYALSISGGILLMILAFNMIFSEFNEGPSVIPKQDPFIVPIATPLLSGGGLLTMIMLYAKEEENNLKLLVALVIAWIGITIVLVTAPYLQIILGRRGLAALEQLMGMILSLIAMDMIVKGTSTFLKVLAAF
jgi:multiple antibiotic resistance protein